MSKMNNNVLDRIQERAKQAIEKAHAKRLEAVHQKLTVGEMYDQLATGNAKLRTRSDVFQRASSHYGDADLEDIFIFDDRGRQAALDEIDRWHDAQMEAFDLLMDKIVFTPHPDLFAQLEEFINKLRTE